MFTSGLHQWSVDYIIANIYIQKKRKYTPNDTVGAQCLIMILASISSQS